MYNNIIYLIYLNIFYNIYIISNYEYFIMVVYDQFMNNQSFQQNKFLNNLIKYYIIIQ